MASQKTTGGLGGNGTFPPTLDADDGPSTHSVDPKAATLKRLTENRSRLFIEECMS
jgi:hypothetical protein